MIAVTDFSVGVFLGRGADFLFLVLLGAMVYSGVVYAKRRGGVAPRVLAWSALTGLVVFGASFLATTVQDGLRASAEAHEMPDVPVTAETWVLLGSLADLGWGTALLVAGVAFVYVGWNEGHLDARRGGAGKKALRK